MTSGFLSRIVLLLAIIGLSFTAQAQIYNPVKWEYSSTSLGNDEYELQFKAVLEEHWHIYSQNLPDEDGPIPTSFAFEANEAIELIGSVEEPEPHSEYDPNFDMELSWFENEVTFTQKIKLLANQTTVKGEITFMVCDPTKCLPPEYPEFAIQIGSAESATVSIDGDAESETKSFSLNSGAEAAGGIEPTIHDPIDWSHVLEKINDTEYVVKITATLEEGWHLYSQNLPSDDGPIATEITFAQEDIKAVGKAKEVGELHQEFDPNFEMDLNYYSDEVTFVQKIEIKESMEEVSGSVYFMVCNDKMCLPPTDAEFDLAVKDAVPYVAEEEGEKEEKEAGSFWLAFLTGLGGGLIALLTPCVFPMIPLTVSFFTKQSKNKAQGISNAILYGLSIICIYTLLGVAVTLIFGTDALHSLSTNLWFNLFLFVLLVVFAMSFFGAFEITLPNSWASKMDDASNKKSGLIGIFFMAATLSIVSFSCTGPIVGSVISIAGPAEMTVTLFGFSVALGLPFGLFAMFPGWLNSLPKSGGWLNSVKVFLGFLELAFAFKFLSNADLVQQWHLLEREMFIAIWIAIFLAMTLYLFGFIKFPHDSPMQSLSVSRGMLAVCTLVFTLYLIPGLWGAPLKLIAGFPPPSFYAESPFGLYKVDMLAKKVDRMEQNLALLTQNGGTVAANGGGTQAPPARQSEGHCPMDLPCFHDYEEGLAYAKQVGKPVMIDFTGWACVNCRRMEEEVWSNDGVWNRLNSDFVLISLYTDEGDKLPESEQYYSEALSKKVKRVGEKWVDLEVKRYGNNAQPHYVVTDHEGNQLHEAANYDPDIEKFIGWLERGKELFYEQHDQASTKQQADGALGSLE